MIQLERLEEIKAISKVVMTIKENVKSLIEKTGIEPNECDFKYAKVVEDCRVEGENLRDKEGHILGGAVGDVYCCHQTVGYLGDDYRGFLYFLIEGDRYLRVPFSC